MRSSNASRFSFRPITITAVLFMLLNAAVPLNFTRQAEATEYPFKLTTTLEKTHYRLGEPVNITVA